MKKIFKNLFCSFILVFSMMATLTSCKDEPEAVKADEVMEIITNDISTMDLTKGLEILGTSSINAGNFKSSSEFNAKFGIEVDEQSAEISILPLIEVHSEMLPGVPVDMYIVGAEADYVYVNFDGFKFNATDLSFGGSDSDLTPANQQDPEMPTIDDFITFYKESDTKYYATLNKDLLDTLNQAFASIIPGVELKISKVQIDFEFSKKKEIKSVGFALKGSIKIDNKTAAYGVSANISLNRKTTPPSLPADIENYKNIQDIAAEVLATPITGSVELNAKLDGTQYVVAFDYSIDMATQNIVLTFDQEKNTLLTNVVSFTIGEDISILFTNGKVFEGLGSNESTNQNTPSALYAQQEPNPIIKELLKAFFFDCTINQGEGSFSVTFNESMASIIETFLSLVDTTSLQQQYEGLTKTLDEEFKDVVDYENDPVYLYYLEMKNLYEVVLKLFDADFAGFEMGFTYDSATATDSETTFHVALTGDESISIDFACDKSVSELYLLVSAFAITLPPSTDSDVTPGVQVN